MRNNFDKQLEMLNNELIEMGSLCEEAISFVSSALETGDRGYLTKIHDADTKIDEKERDIENLCFRLLLQQQPVAKDLREISSALKMISDMERIGDQAGDIGEILSFTDAKNFESKIHLIDMAKATIKMVTDSVNSFVKKDLSMAYDVINYDDTVDKLFIKVKSEISSLMQKDSSVFQYALDFLMIAKYFERIGDHAVNIAEWVIFSLTGIHKSNEL
ncbi:MAG: phosphate signaling complex protein PhoU [Clostridia bacterium]|nr:phosphate signaling complex protein PhoU [Clostridia bacterium]